MTRQVLYRDTRVKLTPEGRARPDLGELLLLVGFLLAQAEGAFRRPYKMKHGTDPFPPEQDPQP